MLNLIFLELLYYKMYIQEYLFALIFFYTFYFQPDKNPAVNKFLGSYIFHYYMTSVILLSEAFHTLV